jgi:chemotaxis protein methyltransferase CheR
MTRFGSAFSGLLDELVRARTGLAPARRDEAARQRVLGLAMQRAGVRDEAAYLRLLERDTRAFDELIADLTVPESYFFRDPPHYELLRQEVLPGILRARAPDHVLELWSAGCAGGEEPYSLAILLEQEKLSERGRVLGTDVSRRAIARAQRAQYARWSLRATSPRDLERYFEPQGQEFALVSRIRERVRFQQHSLTASGYPRPQTRLYGFDLVLCRNVLIYFDAPTKSRVLNALAAQLQPDGVLYLGGAETVLGLTDRLVPMAGERGVYELARAVALAG